MAESTKSVAKSISVLGIAGILCKLVGVFFSILLNRISKDVAADFYLVYPTYTLLLTISSAGLPVAVSRMVAGFLARNDPRNAKSTFRAALLMLSTIGAFFSLLMVLLNRVLVDMVNVEEVSLGFYAIAPCVMIVCVLSAFRGLIQGQQNMVPTAVSQLIEQVGKVALCLPLAAIGLQKSVAAGAAGALFGITLAETLALIYMVVRHHLKKQELERLPQDPEAASMQSSRLMSRLVLISIPITVSACIIPLSQVIDSAMMIRRMLLAGLSAAEAKTAYGIFTSIVIRLINIPTALALAISMSLVPAISACRSRNDQPAVRHETNNGMRYAFLIGFPCSVGMSLLSKQIVYFLYGDVRDFTAAHLQLASELLTFSAMTVVLFTAVQATSSILQGLRKQRIPMYTMIAGVLAKIVLNYILIGTPGIDIHGGPYASIACYFIVMTANLFFICRYTEMRMNWMGWIVRPGLAAAVMGAAVWGLTRVFPMGSITTILEVLAGVVVYLLAAFAVKALSKDDLRAMMRRKGAA